MAVSEYEVENLFIERLGTIGYQFIQLRDYAEVKKNFKDQLQKFNQFNLKNAYQKDLFIIFKPFGTRKNCELPIMLG